MTSKKLIILGLGGIGALAAVGATVFFMGASSPQDNAVTTATSANAQTDTTVTQPSNTQETPQATVTAAPSQADSVSDTLVFTFNDLEVTRPNGVTLTVSAIAACGALDDDYNLNNTTQLAAYEQACKERTQARLDFAMCAYGNPTAHFATNNPEIRAMSLGRDVTTIGENLLWDEGELSRAAQTNHDSYSVISLSSLNDANPIENFVEPEGCGDFAFRGAPRPF
jgi:hypothetical protein